MVFGQWVFLSCEIGVGCLRNRFCLVCGGGFLRVGVSGLVSRFIYVIERVG